MENKTQVTPNRNVINGVNAPLLEKSINQNRKQQQSKHSLIWGTVNVGLLAIILYDLIYTCPLYTSYVQYIEYVGVIILLLNILYHFGKYLRLNLSWNLTSAPVVNSCLSASTPGTPSNKTQLSPELNTPTLSMSSTPMNTSALSWMSNSTPNDSYNFPVKSDSWLYSHGSPQSQNVTPVKVPRPDTSGIDFISDECSLQSYLKDFEANEKKVTTNSYTMTTGNALSTFWSHPLTKNPKDASSFLKRTQYQLSSPTATSASNSPKTDDRGSPRGSPNRGMETWIRLTISVTTLTQWNANLRIYLSQTILHRLITEFDNIDDAFNKHGFNDIQIGKVGLDRLRKTAQTAQALQFIPNLPTLIPFLELTPNQEYLVKRIKELAKTGCMSDFKWNSGSSFNEKDWDASLPTDSAIIMHLFAAYLDTQLLPLPSKPDVKPFSGYHYLKQNEKLPTLTDQTLLIQQCSDSPPHYRVIVGQETHELVKGYNNLFHSILLFLYFVDKKQHGMIGRVNLGKAGLNMLWIIQSS
ncbi:hypothetical protein AMK59_1625 [Oryctes borbonicus]|uniref:Transmembrane protein 209 n=1 Tax=Oryctes borbonicus TaxID=1629725 RepID=A0A0T6B9S8_9SCAR|nr:hypothetical protein AMK59_1625 [Oryctes borbonicus]